MILLWTLQAAADLLPPPELVRPCTVETWCNASEEGTICTESALDVFACQTLSEQGYSRRCTGETDAEGHWQVVYCRNRTEHTQPTEDPVVEDPVVEDPVVEEPVVEDPVVEDPVVEGAPTDEPGTVIPPNPRRCSAVAGGGGVAALFALLAVTRRRKRDA